MSEEHREEHQDERRHDRREERRGEDRREDRREERRDARQETPETAAATPEAPVEALPGLRDFLAVAPRRRSVASTQAAFAGLQRWMQLQGHDTNGFYSMAQWQEYYQDAMRYTG